MASDAKQLDVSLELVAAPLAYWDPYRSSKRKRREVAQNQTKT